ncbi:MAG: hypothetical protein AAF478_06370 [Pseudomonadota bacterium]
MLIAACTQTANQSGTIDPITTASLPAQEPKITETAVGHGNLELSVNGSAKDLFKQRDCVLGRYAHENGVTHILTPQRTEVSFTSVDGLRKSSLDHPFEYFVSGQRIPDGADTKERLMANCKA